MKTQKKYYWKVVQKIDGKYFSMVIRRGKYHLRYTPGEITKSNILESGIFCYETREEARNCKRSLTNSPQILKVIPLGLRIDAPVFYDYDELEYGIKIKVAHNSFPQGTICFPAVKVLGVSS